MTATSDPLARGDHPARPRCPKCGGVTYVEPDRHYAGTRWRSCLPCGWTESFAVPVEHLPVAAPDPLPPTPRMIEAAAQYDTIGYLHTARGLDAREIAAVLEITLRTTYRGMQRRRRAG